MFMFLSTTATARTEKPRHWESGCVRRPRESGRCVFARIRRKWFVADVDEALSTAMGHGQYNQALRDNYNMNCSDFNGKYTFDNIPVPKAAPTHTQIRRIRSFCPVAIKLPSHFNAPLEISLMEWPLRWLGWAQVAY